MLQKIIKLHQKLKQSENLSQRIDLRGKDIKTFHKSLYPKDTELFNATEIPKNSMLLFEHLL